MLKLGQARPTQTNRSTTITGTNYCQSSPYIIIVLINSKYKDCFANINFFEFTKRVEGEVYRKGQGRVTLRFEHQKKVFFLKRHTGIGWREIFKDLLQGRLPIVGAKKKPA